MSKVIKFYKKRSSLDYALFLPPAICFALVFYVMSLEGPERIKWLKVLIIEGRADEQWLYGGVVTYAILGVVMFIVAYRTLYCNKERKAELKLSVGGISCLPMDIHPLEIPWTNIISKPELTEISGKNVLHLRLSDYVPEGYRDELKEVYININRLSGSNKKILNSIQSFYNQHAQ